MNEQAGRHHAQIAALFTAARRDGQALTDYPGLPPAELAEAYQVQDLAIALRAGPIGGWKVGRINPPLGEVERLVGPIFADTIRFADEADPVAMPVFSGGFAAAEAEFLLRIGIAPDPERRQWDLGGAAELVDRVAVGIEIASSPYPGINDHGAAVTVSDFGNNHGLVVGPEIGTAFDAELLDWPVALAVNDTIVGRGAARDMLDGPLGALRFLLEHLMGRGETLRPGQWISTGAVTGVHSVAVGDRVDAAFGNALRLSCSVTSVQS